MKTIKTVTTVLAGTFMMAMAGMAGAAETQSAQQAPAHSMTSMTSQECSTFMAKQAEPKASNSPMAKQQEAYCAKKLHKMLVKEDKLPTATMSLKS